jgi:hypothetical protein
LPELPRGGHEEGRPAVKDAATKLKGKSDAEAVAAIKGTKAHGQIKHRTKTDLDQQVMQSGFSRAAM